MFNEHVWVRFGQLVADGDFFVIKGGDYFLNGWGWPLITSDLPNGGPGYLLATPGVRVILNPNDKFGLKIGLFNGDPAGTNCKGDPLDERVDAVGRPGHAKIGPNIDLDVVVWLVEESCANSDDTAERTSLPKSVATSTYVESFLVNSYSRDPLLKYST
jgi:hypothetical protein